MKSKKGHLLLFFFNKDYVHWFLFYDFLHILIHIKFNVMEYKIDIIRKIIMIFKVI